MWLCRNLKGGPDAALKVYKSVKRYIDYAKEEVNILEAVKACDFGDRDAFRPDAQCEINGPGASAASCVVALFEHFVDERVGCSHPCLALEALGPSLLEVAQSCRGDRLPWDLLLAAVRDSLRGLDLLHRGCRIVHTDIKPENILARVDEAALVDAKGGMPCSKRRRVSNGGGFSGGLASFGSFCFRPKRRHVTGRDVLSATDRCSGCVTFVIADLGNSCFVDRQASDCISTCEYKAPEVLLGSGYGTQADLWSLACTLFEVATGRYLFDPRRVLARPAVLAAADADAAARGKAPELPRGSAGIPTVQEHIAQFVELLGELPEPLLQRGKLSHELLQRGDDGRWSLRTSGLPLDELPRCSVAQRLAEHLQGSEEVRCDDLHQLVKLFEAALVLEPLERPDAHVLLQGAPWLWTRGHS